MKEAVLTICSALAVVACVAPANAGVAKETICHIPPGNPDNARTIEVSSPALGAHLAHGDLLGACPAEGDEPPEPAFSASSVALDGIDDFVDMGEIYPFVTGAPLSLCFWYKTNTPAAAHLIGRQNAGFFQRGYFVHLDNNANVCFSLVANALSLFQRECTTAAPTLGAWHHVCATSGPAPRSFGNMKIYVDGVEAPTNTFGTSLGNSSFSNSGGNFTVGAAVCSPGASCTITPGGDAVPLSRPFQGFVDEAAIWDSTELTAGHIDLIYADGTPSDLSSLSPTSWWRMGECTDGASTLVCDENLANNFHGVLVNGATFSADTP